MTPLITGGSLMGEINWSNAQSRPGGAPIASVESLSPTCKSIFEFKKKFNQKNSRKIFSYFKNL